MAVPCLCAALLSLPFSQIGSFNGGFLPAAGNRNGTEVNNVGANGNYWSSTHNNENNARNVNFNSDNLNPTNNNNRNNGLSVRPVQDFARNDTLLTDLFKAYYDARRNKRNTRRQLEFELDMEMHLIGLYHELRDRTYRPGPCTCFIIEDPVKREVFASDFRDRVVHHLYHNYVSPLFERLFIHDSYSCRKGKGTLFGIERLEHHLRSATDNYTRTAWVLKLDLQGYFMSIDRAMLCRLVCCELRKHWKGRREVLELVLWLTEIITSRDPLEGCVVRGSRADWQGLPPTKSLCRQPPGRGMPIGDLTSQLFSNVLLNRLDQYVKRSLHFRHYGRYVDDFFIVDADKERLVAAVPAIRNFLLSSGLTLHPKKMSLQPSWHSMEFLGAVVRPWQRYVTRRTVASFRLSMRGIEYQHHVAVSEFGGCSLSAVLNSYAGYFSHFKAKKLFFCYYPVQIG